MEDFSFSLEFLIRPIYAWAAFGVVALVYAVLSVVLLYHWKSYVFHPVQVNKIDTFIRIYFIVSVGLIFGMIITLTRYTL